MARIATVVFLDLETTGLPSKENNQTRITELSMVAVKRDHISAQGQLLKSSKEPVSVLPRVVNKLTLCLNPQRHISEGASSISGLTNDLLKDQVHFDERVFILLDNFLSVLEKPVCVVSHNGHTFDFPILKNHLEHLNFHLSKDILCADSIYGIYDIYEGIEERKKRARDPVSDEVDGEEIPGSSISTENGTKKRKLTQAYRPGKKRRIYYENNAKPKLSYKLVDIYGRVVQDPGAASTASQAHRAEGDCIMMLEIAVKMGEDFLQWLDENHCLFSDIKPMTPGIN